MFQRWLCAFRGEGRGGRLLLSISGEEEKCWFLASSPAKADPSLGGYVTSVPHLSSLWLVGGVECCHGLRGRDLKSQTLQ